MLQFEILLSRIQALFDPLSARTGIPADKLAHATGCMVLTALLLLAGAGRFEAFLGALSFGILWEVLGFVWRNVEPDPEDVLADFIGAALLPGLLGLAGLLA